MLRVCFPAVLSRNFEYGCTISSGIHRLGSACLQEIASGDSSSYLSTVCLSINLLFVVTLNINAFVRYLRGAINSHNLDVLVTIETWHQFATDIALQRLAPSGFDIIDQPYKDLCLLSGRYEAAWFVIFHHRHTSAKRIYISRQTIYRYLCDIHSWIHHSPGNTDHIKQSTGHEGWFENPRGRSQVLMGRVGKATCQLLQYVDVSTHAHDDCLQLVISPAASTVTLKLSYFLPSPIMAC